MSRAGLDYRQSAWGWTACGLDGLGRQRLGLLLRLQRLRLLLSQFLLLLLRDVMSHGAADDRASNCAGRADPG